MTHVQVETRARRWRAGIHHLPVATGVGPCSDTRTRGRFTRSRSSPGLDHVAELTRVSSQRRKVKVFVASSGATQHILLLLDAGEGRLPDEVIGAVGLALKSRIPSFVLRCRSKRVEFGNDSTKRKEADDDKDLLAFLLHTNWMMVILWKPLEHWSPLG